MLWDVTDVEFSIILRNHVILTFGFLQCDPLCPVDEDARPESSHNIQFLILCRTGFATRALPKSMHLEIAGPASASFSSIFRLQ